MPRRLAIYLACTSYTHEYCVLLDLNAVLVLAHVLIIDCIKILRCSLSY